MVNIGIIKWKIKEDEGMIITVISYSIILFSSENMKKKIYISDFPPNFFRHFIILVGIFLFYKFIFSHFSHISHFYSIINVSRTPFYNSCRNIVVL